MTEEVVETTEETTEATTEEPQRLPSREEYACSVCGATVVPVKFETDRGIRYRCPKRRRFMNPLTLEDVREKEEEGRGPLLPDDIAQK